MGSGLMDAQGRMLEQDEFRALFTLGDRRAAGAAAPPQGLVLEEVYY